MKGVRRISVLICERFRYGGWVDGTICKSTGRSMSCPEFQAFPAEFVRALCACESREKRRQVSHLIRLVPLPKRTGESKATG